VLPYATPGAPIVLDGLPTCTVKQAEVNALSMVLGELCVNSIKHGALGAGGSIGITGDCNLDRLELVWSERTVKAVTARTREGGQGLKIMQRVLASRRGTIDHDWLPSGVNVRIELTRQPQLRA
jgi:two-component sensor histidine kinase